MPYPYPQIDPGHCNHTYALTLYLILTLRSTQAIVTVCNLVLSASDGLSEMRVQSGQCRSTTSASTSSSSSTSNNSKTANTSSSASSAVSCCPERVACSPVRLVECAGDSSGAGGEFGFVLAEIAELLRTNEVGGFGFRAPLLVPSSQ